MFFQLFISALNAELQLMALTFCMLSLYWTNVVQVLNTRLIKTGQ
jgi:hypothetical protein